MKISFLGVVTEIKNGRLSTDLSFKLVDSYQYLHYKSCHEEHLKNYHLQSNFRLRKICLERKVLKSHVENLKGWFLRRCYPQWVAKEKVDKVLRLPLEHDTQKNKNTNGLALAITYMPHLGFIYDTAEKI